jgi:hypothetical protein
MRPRSDTQDAIPISTSRSFNSIDDILSLASWRCRYHESVTPKPTASAKKKAAKVAAARRMRKLESSDDDSEIEEGFIAPLMQADPVFEMFKKESQVEVDVAATRMR